MTERGIPFSTPRERKSMTAFKSRLNEFMNFCHHRSVLTGWYGENGRKKRNVGEMIALIHSELSEALEGYRKNLQDNHLPHRKMIEVELADTLVRVGDLAAYLKLDVGGAVDEKLEYNLHREDHKPEARKGRNGKRF